jgi:hypothetical protein
MSEPSEGKVVELNRSSKISASQKPTTPSDFERLNTAIMQTFIVMEKNNLIVKFHAPVKYSHGNPLVVTIFFGYITFLVLPVSQRNLGAELLDCVAQLINIPLRNVL